MNENLFRFTLNNTIEGELQISEPDGWKEATLKLERDKEYHSLVEFYDQVFTFYGRPSLKYNGGYDYIKYVLTTQGPDADITITVELSENGGSNYETLFDGLIKLSEIKEIANSEFYKIQVGIIRDDFWSRFMNQKGTSINVQAATDIYGVARPVLNTQEINLSGQKIKKTFDGYFEDTIGFREDVDNLSIGRFIEIDTTKVNLSEIDQKFNLLNIINPTAPVNILEADLDGDYVFDLQITCSNVFYSQDGVWPACAIGGHVQITDTKVRFYIQKNSETPIAFIATNSPLVLLYTFTEYNYNATLSLVRGDLITIYGEIIDSFDEGEVSNLVIYGKNRIVPVSTVGTFNNGVSCQTLFYTNPINIDLSSAAVDAIPSYFKIYAYTTFPDSTSEEILLHEATQSVLDRIIGQDDTLYSEYLGNVDTQRSSYTENGCFSYSSIAKGLHKKGFTFTEKPLSISFDQIWKGLDPMFCLGLGYEQLTVSPDKTVIRIEEKSYFYHNVPILNLSWVNNIEHSIDVDKIFKNIKIGYQKWESESISGLDEVQTKHEYAVPLKKIGESIEIYSQFIGAALAQENTRRQSVEKSKDYRLDNDIFITHLYPNGSPAYIPYTATNIGALTPSGTGIDFPESRYNLLFTVARNFERWKAFFNGGVQFNDAYLFQGGEGNTDAIINDGGGVCGLGEIGEDDNFAIANNYLFGFDVYEFEHPLTWAEYKLIRDNRRRSIGVSQTDEGHAPFFILSLEWSPVTPKGKFRVLKGFPANGELNCVTADSTLVSADNAIITADCDGGSVYTAPFEISSTLDYDLDAVPTWNTAFVGNPAGGNYNENLIGDDTWASQLDYNDNTSVTATASKVTSGGLSGGDVIVRFIKNGIVVNSQSFGNGANVSNVNYTFAGLLGGESFEVTILEDRENFILSALLTPFSELITYRVEYGGYMTFNLEGNDAVSNDINPTSSSFNVNTSVVKTNNSSIAQDVGFVLWLRNGVTENTQNFNTGDTVSYSYEFIGVNPGDELSVQIMEG